MTGKFIPACVVVMLLFPLTLSRAQQSVYTEPTQQGKASSRKSVSPLEPKTSPGVNRMADGSGGELLSFRYWMVPSDKIEQWPWGHRKYCPVKATVFDHWIKEFENLRKESVPGDFPGRIESIRLEARLEGENLVEGSGRMSLTLPGRKGAPISLSPFSFAWYDYLWPDQSIATVSLCGDQTIQIESPQQDELNFRWSLRGKTDRQGNIIFQPRLTSAPIVELILDIPIEYIPGCSVGIVRQLESPNARYKRWICYLGGHSRPQITVTPVAINTNIQQKTGYQQEISYRISLEGISATSRFIFARPEIPIHQFAIVLDRPMKLTDIRWEDNHPVKTLSRSTEKEVSRIVVDFDANENETAVLRVDAFMSFQPDRLIRLPRIRILSEKILWKETQCRLLIVPSMIATDFRLEQATQAYTPIPVDGSPVSPWFFKYFASDAWISVACSELKTVLRFDSMSDVLFLPDEIVADTVLNFRPESEHSQLVFHVRPGWEVESVQSEAREELIWEYMNDPLDWPAAANNPHESEHRPGDNAKSGDVKSSVANTSHAKSETTNRAISRRVVRVFLKKPFTRDYSFPLRVRSRRVTHTASKLPVDQLSPLDLSHVISGNHYIRLRSESPYQVRIFDWSGIPYETPLSLQNDSMLRQFLPDTASGSIMLLGDDSAGCTSSIEKRTSDYSANLSSHILVENKNVTQQWTIRCIPPTGSRIDRVLVAFRQTVPGRSSGTKVSEADVGKVVHDPDWKWSLAGEDQQAFEIHELGDDELKALSVPPSSRVWELRLQTSRSVPFDINAVRTVPLSSSRCIPLVYLPEIPLLRADVLVETTGTDPVAIETSQMSRIPVRLAGQNELESIKGAFAYNPTEVERIPAVDSTEYKPVSLIVGPGKKEVSSALRSFVWCWFLCFDSQHDAKGVVRNHAMYYLENRGAAFCRVTLPPGVDFSAVHAVGIDEKRVTWYPETEEGTNVVRVRLPSRRRFFSLFLEFHTTEPPLRKERRLLPNLPRTDFAVLDGLWRIWLPPEWRADSGHSLAKTSFLDDSGFIADRLLQKQTRTIRQTAEFLVSRLGDETLFKQLLWEKRRNESETPPAESEQTATVAAAAGDDTAKGVPRSGSILTWGDMLSNIFFSSKLFPESRTRGTPSIYIDRYSLNQAGIVPSSPIRWRENPSSRGKGLGTLEDAGLILLFLNAHTVLVTTASVSVKYRQDLIPLCGDCIWYPRNKAFGEGLLNSFVENRDSNIVPAWFWRSDNIGSTSPWVPTLRGSRLLSETPRWNAREFSLADAANGVVVSDWHRLVAQKWFFFLAVFVFTCRRPCAGSIVPFFLVLLVGMTGIISCTVSSTYIYPLEGIMFGSLFSLACYAVRSLRTTLPEVPMAETTAVHPVPVIMADDETESSVPGFVSIASSVTPTPGALLEASDTQERTQIVCDDVIVRSVSRSPRPDSHGRTTLKTLVIVLIAFVGAFIIVSSLAPLRVSGQTVVPGTSSAMPTIPEPGTTTSLQSKPLTIPSTLLRPNESIDLQRPAPTLFGMEYGTPRTQVEKSVPNDVSTATSEQTPNEPWRVFVPVDKNRKPLENYYYWIPEEFYAQLRDAINRRQNSQNQWSISDAKYVGAVNYNSATGTLSLFHLKATYKLRLESTQATITFPMMSLQADGGARFDRQPIVPLYRKASASETENTSNPEGSKAPGDQPGSLVFEISNSTPGEHILELSLTMPQFSVGQGGSIAIPPVPNSRLELTIPPDAPKIGVYDSLGVVSYNGGKITAELGPTRRLTLSKLDESGKSGTTTIDVEQLFRIHARSNQTDLHARFVYRIAGGKVKTLYLQHDPRYLFSGQCNCSEAQIESVETDPSQKDLVRVTFKRPVSGMLTLSTNYVVEGFSGVGQIRLPRIKAVQCRITRSWMGVTASPSVSYVNLPPGDVSTRVFQNVWGESENIVVRAAYDLLRPNPGWLVSIQLKNEPMEASQRLALAFCPAHTSIDYRADVRGLSNLLRCTFRVDPHFVPESVSVFDENNGVVETPEYYQTPGKLFLLFRMPLSGRHFIRIKGKTKSELGRPFDLPVFRLEGTVKQQTRLKIYRSPSLYLDLSKPIAKAGSENESVSEQLFADLTPAPLYIGDFYLEENVDTSVNTQLSVQVHLRFNRPRVTGKQQTILFQRLNLGWEAAVLFSLDVRHGELDAFELELDELCSGPVVVEPSAMWQVVPTQRKKVVRIQPNTFLRGKAEFQVYLPLTANTETLRLPRIGLVTLASRLNQSVTPAAKATSPASDAKPRPENASIPIRATIDRYIFLPLREQNNLRSLRWDTIGLMKLVTPPGQIAVGMSQGRFDAQGDNLFSDAVTRFSGMTRGDFQQYQVTRDDHSAAIILGSNSPLVTGAEYLFCLHADGSLSGSTVMDLRVAQKDHCFMRLPPKYKPLEISVDGLGQSIQPDSKGRVRLDLDTRRYSQRIELTFHIPSRDLPAATRLLAVRGRIPTGDDSFMEEKPERNPQGEEPSGAQTIESDDTSTETQTNNTRTNETENESKTKRPRHALSKKLFESHQLHLPRLENIPVAKAYWICTIEYDMSHTHAVDGPCLVAQHCLDSCRDELYRMGSFGEKTMSQSNWRLPISLKEANPILLCFNFEKMEHLLRVFESGIGSFSGEEKDLQQWYSRWLLRWWTCKNEMESLLLPDYAPTVFSKRQRMAIFQKLRPKKTTKDLRDAPMEIDALSPSSIAKSPEEFGIRQVSMKDYRDLVATHQKLIETWQLQSTHDSLLSRKSATMSAFAIWRLNHATNTKFLFGLTDEDIDEIEIFVPKRSRLFPFAVLGRMFAWLLLTVAVLFLMRSVGQHPRIRRNVHYFSLLVGLFWIWFLTHPFVGWIIIVLGFWIRFGTRAFQTPPVVSLQTPQQPPTQ